MTCHCCTRLGPSQESAAEFNERFSQSVARLIQGLKLMSVLRAKVRVSQVLHVKDADGATTQEQVSLTAVYGKDGSANAMWSKWTPSANFVLHINNPAAFGKLSSGHEFYVDFTPAEKEA